MVDHRILMYILYQKVIERALYKDEVGKNNIGDSAFIFFPVAQKEYYDKLNALNASQYLERLRMLCPILGRTN
jgi:hypothetical protein